MLRGSLWSTVRLRDGGADLLTTFQVHVARIFFGLKASEGYVVAGGAALLASDLVSRTTQDLDLFASSPIASVAEAKAALVRALGRRDYDVELIHDSATSAGWSSRPVVSLFWLIWRLTHRRPLRRP